MEVKELKEYLKKMRIDKHLTQAQVAKKLFITRQAYNLIENGQRQKDISMTMLTKLAEVFGVPEAELMAEERKLQSTAS